MHRNMYPKQFIKYLLFGKSHSNTLDSCGNIENIGKSILEFRLSDVFVESSFSYIMVSHDGCRWKALSYSVISGVKPQSCANIHK